MTENWRRIPGFEDYEVSDVGHVRRDGKLKALTADRNGYLRTTLWRAGQSYRRQVSNLVAEAFIGPRPKGMVVAHGNGVNSDDRLENLRYCTRVENEADKRIHGTHIIGEDHGRAVLTEAQALEIRHKYKPYSRTNSTYALGRQYRVSHKTIHLIIARKIWRHL